MDSRLTKDEGVALHLVHHMGAALTVKQAAKQMGFSVSTVRRLLESAEHKTPDLFPVLTSKQASVLHQYEVEGLSAAQISMARGVSVNVVRRVLRGLRKTGILKDGGSRRVVSFNEATMSDKVVSKW